MGSSEFDLDDIFIWVGQFETFGTIFHPEAVFIFLPCPEWIRNSIDPKNFLFNLILELADVG